MLPWSIGGGGGDDAPACECKNCVKCNKIRTDRCNSLGPPHWVFLTKPQCHKASKQLLNPCPIPPVHVIVRLFAG